MKVLVPVDFSETSRRALAWAFDYAARAPCEVHVLHVIDESVGANLPQRLRDRFSAELLEMSEAAEEEFDLMLKDAEERARVLPLHRHLVRGRPAHAILHAAERLGADMIVVGTHGRSGLAGLLIGSVAEKVVRHANCPVVCVKPGKASIAPAT